MVTADAPLPYQSLRDIAGQIKAKTLSPVEVLQLMLDRIDQFNGHLHGYATLMTEDALEAARRAEAEIESGAYRGPLHGIPVAVKDLCSTR